MTQFFIVFWTVIVFTSIAWYAGLLLVVGSKAGREIREMTNKFDEERNHER